MSLSEELQALADLLGIQRWAAVVKQTGFKAD